MRLERFQVFPWSHPSQRLALVVQKRQSGRNRPTVLFEHIIDFVENTQPSQLRQGDFKRQRVHCMSNNRWAVVCSQSVLPSTIISLWQGIKDMLHLLRDHYDIPHDPHTDLYILLMCLHLSWRSSYKLCWPEFGAIRNMSYAGGLGKEMFW